MSSRYRKARVRNFKAYVGSGVSFHEKDKGEYAVMHPFADDEGDTEFGVDAWWQHEGEVFFIEVMPSETPSMVVHRERDPHAPMHLIAHVKEDKITRALFEDAMTAFAESGLLFIKRSRWQSGKRSF